MPQTRTPRRGSLQFWPRKRAKRSYARVRAWADSKDAKLQGFAGYKVGMTHLIINDNRKNATTKGMDVAIPATIIECPPIKAIGLRFYKKTLTGANCVGQILSTTFDKELSRKITVPKKKDGSKEPENYDYVRVLAHTQPKLTSIGNKKPEIFEIALGGKKDEQVAAGKELLGKDISVADVFAEGQQLDMHGITKAKGVQGPVRRFGINLKNHKGEKSRRTPGSLGGWIAQGHIMWRTAKAGKMGYHTRTEHNKWVIKIGKDAKEFQAVGGFPHYGNITSDFIVVKGSISGPQKRIIRMTQPTRPNKKIPQDAPSIKHVSQ